MGAAMAGLSPAFKGADQRLLGLGLLQQLGRFLRNGVGCRLRRREGRRGLVVGADRRLEDLRRVGRGLAAFDGVDPVHAGNHAAENGIGAVEPEERLEHDEELAVGAVGLVGAGHGDGAAHMRQLVEFGLEVGKVGPALPCALADRRSAP
jgi:hypothetical protein